MATRLVIKGGDGKIWTIKRTDLDQDAGIDDADRERIKAALIDQSAGQYYSIDLDADPLDPRQLDRHTGDAGDGTDGTDGTDQ